MTGYPAPSTTATTSLAVSAITRSIIIAAPSLPALERPGHPSLPARAGGYKGRLSSIYVSIGTCGPRGNAIR